VEKYERLDSYKNNCEAFLKGFENGRISEFLKKLNKHESFITLVKERPSYDLKYVINYEKIKLELIVKSYFNNVILKDYLIWKSVNSILLTNKFYK